jgi:hypothetical protein
VGSRDSGTDEVERVCPCGGERQKPVGATVGRGCGDFETKGQIGEGRRPCRVEKRKERVDPWGRIAYERRGQDRRWWAEDIVKCCGLRDKGLFLQGVRESREKPHERKRGERS